MKTEKFNLIKFHNTTSKKKLLIRKYLKTFRKKPVNYLDDAIHEIHHRVFEEFDCLVCANCCKSISPALRDKDIDKISKHLKMKPSLFVTNFLRMDEEGDYVFRKTPCPFLMKDNYCSIYEVRPKACKDYPHTDRKNFLQLTSLTLKNITICPASIEIFDILMDKKDAR